MLQAEEDGPFPGRLDIAGGAGALWAGGLDGAMTWNNYRSELRTIAAEGGYSREDLVAKGARVLPARVKPDVAISVPKKLRQSPILSPYDFRALAWMPEDLPDFVMPEGAGTASLPWRFTINLGEDGGVLESISIAGGDDAGPAAMEDWLRGIRFKPGAGDRWMGLSVEFVNKPDNGTEPE